MNSDRKWAVVIGSGLALSPIHNQWLTSLVTKDGEVGFFLPAFGTAIWLIATLYYVAFNWKGLDWGDRKLYIPLFIIVCAIGLSGITADRWQDKIAPLFMGLSMFSLYLVSRKLGKDMFLPLAIGAGVASFGIILHAIIFPGQVTGGFVFELNYDIAVGYILLGASLFYHRYQWLLACLALATILLSGSPEGLFAVAIIGLLVMFRRDWGKKLLIASIPILIIVVLLFSLGYGQRLYSYALEVSQGIPTSPRIASTELYKEPVSDRFTIIKEAMSVIKPLGEGYYVTAFVKNTVHNVPLIIVQQLGYPGILAAIAWLWVSIWCLVKTKWKYTWALMLALGVFDHFTWTQLAPWWWAIAGASLTSKNSDLIFKEHHGKVRLLQ